MLCRRQGTRGYSSGWKIQIQTKKRWMKPSNHVQPNCKLVKAKEWKPCTALHH
jgi:hypothetical protein